MALGKKCRSYLTPKRSGLIADEGLELGLVKYARTFGRKRIVISNNGEGSAMDSIPKTPLKKRCERSSLEALPSDILIQIVSGVDHEDLNQLSHVSKAIREATVVAKECHFAYSTPKKVRAFRTAIDMEEWSEADEIEAPNAPIRSRPRRSWLGGKNLESLSVKLFASPDEEQ